MRDRLHQNKCMQIVKTWLCDIFQFDGPIWKLDISSWSLESQDDFYDMQWMN